MTYLGLCHGSILHNFNRITFISSLVDLVGVLEKPPGVVCPLEEPALIFEVAHLVPGM